jgi:hypothetical protein
MYEEDDVVGENLYTEDIELMAKINDEDEIIILYFSFLKSTI